MNHTISSSFCCATMLLIHMISTIITPAAASDRGAAHVMIDGSIVEAACAIEIGVPDQALHMGNHPLSKIIRGQRLPSYTLSIKIAACSLAHYLPKKPGINTFKIMFEGEEDIGHFKNSGSAGGIALMISDEQGNIASPGKYLPVQRLVNNNVFNYTLSLINNQQIIQSGELQLTLRFRIDYN